jgi:hypothetical protein
MSRDLYADGFELAEQVRAVGHASWAIRIEESIEYGSTSSEILFGLWKTTDELLHDVPGLPEATRELAIGLTAAIRQVLKGSG